MTQSTLGDPFSSAAKRDAYPFYAQLRATQSVCCLTLPSGRRRWLITRYDDAERALHDTRLIKAGFSDDLPPEIRPPSVFPGAVHIDWLIWSAVIAVASWSRELMLSLR
jgi:cytochrome P450